MIPAPPAAPLLLTQAQNGAVVTVRSGQAVQVRLPDPSPARPDWLLVRGPPQIVLTGRRFAPAAARGAPGSADPFGADVIDLRVQAAAGQIAPLSFAYRLSDRRLTFARIWQVRLRVAGPPASDTPSRR